MGKQNVSGSTSSEKVTTDAGRQYHIGLKEGEVNPYILFCGDPARAKRIAKLFDTVEEEHSNREYLTLTGSYNDIPLSVMATGMGPDNMEIAVVELLQIVEEPTFLRIGSCGSLKTEIELGDVVVSTGALRLENTSTYFVHEGFPSIAHHEIVIALLKAADELDISSHSGITATGSGFYGAQGRDIEGFPLQNPDLSDQLKEMNVANFEMESSTLFTLSSVQNIRAGTVCGVYANRPRDVFVGDQEKKETEMKAIQCGLRSIEILQKMDQQKESRGQSNWIPDFDL